MKKIKKLIERFKGWLIHKLGGNTSAEVLSLKYELFSMRKYACKKATEPWRKVVQEICRKTDTQYYDWACEYCLWGSCKKRNGWCERFLPKPANGLPRIDINALDQRQRNNE